MAEITKTVCIARIIKYDRKKIDRHISEACGSDFTLILNKEMISQTTEN